jgi:hypothetical protein
MAHTTSALRTKMSTEANNNEGVEWSSLEAAVEVLKLALEALTITIDPGNVTVGTVTANAGTNLNTSLLALESTIVAREGIVTETAPATDTASSGLNGRLQRIAQRITSLIALVPTALGAGGGLKVDGSGTALPVSGSVTALSGIAANLKAAATLDAETTKVIGTINIAAAQTLATVTTVAAVTAITNALPAGTNNIGKVSPPTGTKVNSAVYETGHVLKASAGILIYVSGYNSGPTQFIQLHDSATVPADTAVPVKIISVPATSNFSIDIPLTGLAFGTGIAVCNSSTGPTKTIGSADIFFTSVVI